MLPLLASPLGSAYALSGRSAEAIPLLEEAVSQAVSMQRMGEHSSLVARLGEAYLLAGRLDEAGQSAHRALELARAQKERGREAYALRLVGEVASRGEASDLAEAEASYGQALALAEELGMRPLVAHCHLGLGRLYGRTRRRDDAEQHLTAAIGSFRSLDMPQWLERAESERRSLA
jgi:tetratricopeptide (TPR) repeat protein